MIRLGFLENTQIWVKEVLSRDVLVVREPNISGKGGHVPIFAFLTNFHSPVSYEINQRVGLLHGVGEDDGPLLGEEQC